MNAFIVICVLKFYKMFCGHLKKIWGLFFLGSLMRLEVFKVVLWPLTALVAY